MLSLPKGFRVPKAHRHPHFLLLPVSPDQATPPVAPSAISAVIEIGMPALTREVERSVPRRIATFNDRQTTCWRRRLLGLLVLGAGRRHGKETETQGNHQQGATGRVHG